MLMEITLQNYKCTLNCVFYTFCEGPSVLTWTVSLFLGFAQAAQMSCYIQRNKALKIDENTGNWDKEFPQVTPLSYR